jgi:hypothetical protein
MRSAHVESASHLAFSSGWLAAVGTGLPSFGITLVNAQYTGTPA